MPVGTNPFGGIGFYRGGLPKSLLEFEDMAEIWGRIATLEQCQSVSVTSKISLEDDDYDIHKN